MKSKIVSSNSFKNTLNYVLNKDKAELISSNLIGSSVKDFTDQFEDIRRLKQTKKPVLHIPLSCPQGETLTDQKWQEVIDLYFKKMGLDKEKNQYVAVRHSDNDYDHIHLVINKVDYDLKLFNEAFSAKRSIKACEEIEKELNLTNTKAIINSNRDIKTPTFNEIKKEQRTGNKSNKTILQEILNKNLKDSDNIKEFLLNTLKDNVKIHSNLSATTDRVSGMSFEINGVSFKGSALGQKFSYNKLKSKYNFNDSDIYPILKDINDNKGYYEKLDQALDNDKSKETVVKIKQPTPHKTLEQILEEVRVEKEEKEKLAKIEIEKKIKEEREEELKKLNNISSIENEKIKILNIRDLLEIKQNNKYIHSFYKNDNEKSVYWKTTENTRILETNNRITLENTSDLSFKKDIDFMIDRAIDHLGPKIRFSGEDKFVEEVAKNLYERSLKNRSSVIEEIAVSKEQQHIIDRYFNKDFTPKTEDNTPQQQPEPAEEPSKARRLRM